MTDMDWLKKSISRGLQSLVVLHLDGSPSADTVIYTANIWYAVVKKWPISWEETLDKPRLSAAFLQLASESQRWPSPSQLRAVLPARRYPDLQLPEPEFTPEQIASNKARIKDLINQTFKRP